MRIGSIHFFPHRNINTKWKDSYSEHSNGDCDIRRVIFNDFAASDLGPWDYYLYEIILWRLIWFYLLSISYNNLYNDLIEISPLYLLLSPPMVISALSTPFYEEENKGNVGNEKLNSEGLDPYWTPERKAWAYALIAALNPILIGYGKVWGSFRLWTWLT